MEEGAIILTSFPQDASQKPRPALILRKLPGYGDYLICAVSTQLHQHIPDFDLIINSNDPGFENTGLKSSSIVRLSVLTVLPYNRVLGVIGKIESAQHQQLLKNLGNHLFPAV